MSSEELLVALETMKERICREPLPLDGAGVPIQSRQAEQDLHDMRDDGSWSDINYDCDALRDWDAAGHLRRLHVLAKCWYRSDSPLSRRKDVLEAVRRGLDYWYDRDPVNPNWWWNQIGAPMTLGNCLLHVAEVCGQERIERAVPLFERFHPGSRFTGQNLVWVACIAIRHGMLTKDPALTSEGFSWIGREVEVMPRAEGIQPDLSFFQHGLLLYSGGYGAGFICDVANFATLASGTAYTWPEIKMKLLDELILDGTRWMVRGRTFDPGIIGREITRAGHNAARYFSACESMAAIPGPRQREFLAVVDAAGQGSTVTGNKHFWCSDLMTHHRPGFYASVRLASDRVLGADAPCCGGEGRLNHHMAEGATFFMRSGDEYRDLYPVWNWQQVPGTTAEQIEGGMDPGGLRRFGEKGFAGGVSDGRVGGAAMDFSREALCARKATFFFDQTVLCLGAGITCASTHPVRTSIEQCHLQGMVSIDDGGGTRRLEVGEHACKAGASVEHNGFVYCLVEGDAILSTAHQSGAWSDCGVGPDEVESRPVFNLGIDHGTGIERGEYAYRVSPAGTDDGGELRIVENSERVQAAWSEGEGIGMAVLYEPGVISFDADLAVGVDRPCALVAQREADGGLMLTASDPAQGSGVLVLRLRGLLTLELGLPLPGGTAAGSSTTLTLRG
ncbi:polysaccharide lyase family 8 super-sandwich domain-containing protein [Candidatus Latescibacterota bacterium]